MTKEQVETMMTTPEIIGNLEYFTTGSGTIISTSRIRGFVRYKKLLKSKKTQNVMREGNFYYTFDPEEVDVYSAGTLKISTIMPDALEYTESSTGRTFFITFDDIKNLSILKTDDPRYASGGQTV